MSQTRAALSRADLLLALRLADDDVPMAARLAAVLQFMPKPEPPDRLGLVVEPGAGRVTITGHAPTVIQTGSESPTSQREVLQAPLWAVVARRPASAPPEPRPMPLTEAAQPVDLSPRTPGGGLPWRPLLRPARLRPALRAALSVSRPGGIDWTVLQRQLAQAQVPVRLPLALRPYWGGPLWVVVDMGQRMRPYRDDMRAIVQWLAAFRGQADMAVWGVADRPDQPPSVPKALQIGRAHV